MSLAEGIEKALRSAADPETCGHHWLITEHFSRRKQQGRILAFVEWVDRSCLAKRGIYTQGFAVYGR